MLSTSSTPRVALRSACKSPWVPLPGSYDICLVRARAVDGASILSHPRSEGARAIRVKDGNLDALG